LEIIIKFSLHALEKIDAYGTDIEDVNKVIKQGMKWKEEKEDKWHARMAGFECVFTKIEDVIFVITVYKYGGKK
jgi:hypothetical protein